jgi:hypothetical protein
MALTTLTGIGSKNSSPAPLVIATSMREVTFNRSIQQAGPVATVMVRPVARKQADPSLRMKT